MKNENAANRNSYVGDIYSIGENEIKKQILNTIDSKWKKLHNDGYIHIHDLDSYGKTYNCLTLNLFNNFPYDEFNCEDDVDSIISVFNFIINIFTMLGQEQSGGMAFANFDNELATVLANMNVQLNDTNKRIIDICMKELIIWCNNHTRMGKTSYYTTFNIGLANNELARYIAFSLLNEFYKQKENIIKPNIVFKVKKGINFEEDTINHELYKLALKSSVKKMIPTFVICDSKTNKDIDPNVLSIMGCRTRVVDNLHGTNGAIGRGNIANVSINLPKLALEATGNTISNKVSDFKKRWKVVAEEVAASLIDRYEMTVKSTKENYQTNNKYKLWCVDFDNLEEVFKHGTLSIGFIGLSEAIEVLVGSKYYENKDNYFTTYGFIKYMREYCDYLTQTHKLNFSLLASSGELISGRFIEIDKKIFDPNLEIFKKGFYTNSFHINVDSKLPAVKKIAFEGLFHELCNGGCITYVELNEAPIGNEEAVNEMIATSIEKEIHYLGVNFPKDVCSNCDTTGLFDTCFNCGSDNITRIRRVSGYLEVYDGFTTGKSNEVKYRKENGGL